MSTQSEPITIEDLFREYSEKLQLQWVAGQEGKNREILPENMANREQGAAEKSLDLTDEISLTALVSTGKSFVGYLNLIHPHQIQILGNTELSYIENLRATTRDDVIRQLFDHDPACILLADGREIPEHLKQKCDELNVPMLISPLNSNRLIDSFHYYLANLFSEDLTIHGVFMEVMAIGVLITGPSGVGKSELALELITRGHRLIADDAPQFSRIAPDIINGTCPATLRDYLEVRGMGIINIRRLYGDSAIKENKYLKLIVRLEPMSEEQMLQLDRLEGSHMTRSIMEIDIPEITLPVTPGRNLAILLECAARNHNLIASGYNAAEEFIENQQQMINLQSE
ncbi:MAG: HPr kinase/phosphorylase [Gammaproteobacteria bacterium]|jgi:HPr kinase/phosphorylase